MLQRKKTRVVIAAAAGILIVTLAVAAVLWSPWRQSSTPDAPAQDADLPTITIGADILEPSFYVSSAGGYIGIDADIATEACRRAGLKPKFTTVSWAERDEALASGAIDCIWGCFAIDGREDDYLWTESYRDSSIAILVKSSLPFHGLTDYVGSGCIAVRANSAAARMLQTACSDNPDISIHTYGNADMARVAFVKGYTDAWAGPKMALEAIRSEYPREYRYLESNLATTHLGVAFEKNGDTAYRDRLDKALASMRDDGTIERIVKRYEKEAADGDR